VAFPVKYGLAMSMVRLWRDQRKPQQPRWLTAASTEAFDSLDLKEAKALPDESTRWVRDFRLWHDSALSERAE
jgi:hypothetical protein